MIIPGLQGELRPFQEECVRFTDKKKGRILNASDMGLGKTIESLAWLQLHPELRPAIVVCPCAVKENWRRETMKWMGLKWSDISVLNGRPDQNQIYHLKDIVILNYAILPSWVNLLKAPGRKRSKVVIIDEAHYCKNRKAGRTKAVKNLCKHTPHVLCLTGTPVLNRPVEIYEILSLLKIKGLPSWWEYTKEYCDRKHNSFGWDTTGASNVEELNKKLLKTCMIRRTKEEVLPELPPKTRTILPVDLDNRKEYDEAERDFLGWLRGKDPSKAEKAAGAPFLARLGGLRKLSARGKLSECLAWTRNFLESGEKLIVACWHNAVVETFLAQFPAALSMYGKTKRKDLAVELFNEDERAKLMVANVQVLQGMNLHRQCSNMAVVELPLVPAYLDQAEDRICRMGQTKGANYWYLIAAGTVEERIMELLDKKREVLSQVLDGKEVESESLLTELMEEMGR